MIKNMIRRFKTYMAYKAEQHRLLQESNESVGCPHCKQIHKPTYFYENKTKTEDVEMRSLSGSRKTINFLRCQECNELFGVTTSHYYEPVPTLIRTSFKVQ